MYKVITTIVIVLILRVSIMKCSKLESPQNNQSFGCYQCNSHKDDECNYLDQLSDEERKGFYKICEYEDFGVNTTKMTKFCRKMEILSKMV